MNSKPKSREARAKAQSTDMSAKTKAFIHRICSKRSASVDMTRHGFCRDCKLTPLNLLMIPLRKKLEEICGKEKPHNEVSETLDSKTNETRKKVRYEKY